VIPKNENHNLNSAAKICEINPLFQIKMHNFEFKNQSKSADMKKILLLLLTVNFGFAQMRTVQVKLVNPNVGGVHYFENMIESAGSSSNDDGLNQIFQNHNVSFYYDGYGHPLSDLEGNIKLMDCNGCNADQLAADLTAYSSVIQRANVSPERGTFSDVVQIKPIDTDLQMTGTDANNIIITNNAVVNQIFQDRQVYLMNHFLTWRTLVCDCNVADLAADLLANNIMNPNTINDQNEMIHDNYNYTGVVLLLKNKDFETHAAKVYPNPFQTTFTIDSKERIIRYAIFDISGKQLVSTNLKSELDAQSLSLKSGLYLLQLKTETGKISNQKLIKQ
jgi:hypothetical protein